MRNDKLEELRGIYKEKGLQETLDVFPEIESMLDDLNRIFCEDYEIKSLRFLYTYPELVFFGEHEESHNFDNIDDYAREIPPIVRLDDGEAWLGNDGNHRINTLRYNKRKVPCVLIEIEGIEEEW